MISRSGDIKYKRSRLRNASHEEELDLATLLAKREINRLRLSGSYLLKNSRRDTIEGSKEDALINCDASLVSSRENRDSPSGKFEFLLLSLEYTFE